MKENTLLKLAIICALIGLIVLYFISTRININEYKPSVLNKNIGDDVKLQGIITKITDNSDVAFVEVNYQNPVTVVLFKNNEDLSLNSGDNIEIIGKVQEYKGKEEIIASKVRIINKS